ARAADCERRRRGGPPLVPARLSLRRLRRLRAQPDRRSRLHLVALAAVAALPPRGRRGERAARAMRERTCPAWYQEDNKFRTRRRMDHAHRPIVALACRTLRGRGGDVIDLGCGNGALLAKIHALEPAATPFGVERDPLRVAHARVLLP